MLLKLLCLLFFVLILEPWRKTLAKSKAAATAKEEVEKKE